MTRWSLRSLLVLLVVIALGFANWVTLTRLKDAEGELERLRREVGQLGLTDPLDIAAIRVPTDVPLTYRFRVRVPEHPNSVSSSQGSPSSVWTPEGNPPSWMSSTADHPSLGNHTGYRIAYSTVLPKDRATPDWYAAIAVPAGESLVTVQIAEDPRDETWKISTLVRTDQGTRRIGTALPESHTRVFRSSHDVISTGVARETVSTAHDESLRLLDDRWLVSGQSLLLYGDKAPDEDQIGVYAELQNTSNPIQSNRQHFSNN